MHLSAEEVSLFYKLMFGLQFFVNQQLHILPDISSIKTYTTADHEKKLRVRDAVYEHRELIDAFITANPDHLPEAELTIVAGWKNFVAGDFYIERYLKKYSIWISGDEPARIYGVLGISDGIDEIVHKSYLPMRVKSVLLPFKGRIVYDGLFQPYNVLFGGGIKAELQEIYMAAKQNGRIIESLDPQALVQPAKHNQTVQRSWRPELAALAELADKLKGQKVPLQSEAFNLIKVSIHLAQAVADNPENLDTLWQKQRRVERALHKLATALQRATM